MFMQPSVEASPLPSTADLGERRDWVLPTGRDGTVELDGVFLGMGSSQKAEHRAHDGRYAGSNVKCQACRWFELRIFRATDDGHYLLHFAGRSRVPGEQQLCRHEEVLTHFEVVEALTTRHASDSGPASAFLTFPVARAIAQAAALDEDLRDAFINRAAV